MEESYEDLLFAQKLTANSEEGQKKFSPDQLSLTEGEKAVLELFRQIPEDQQPMVLAMIKAALNGNK